MRRAAWYGVLAAAGLLFWWWWERRVHAATPVTAWQDRTLPPFEPGPTQEWHPTYWWEGRL